MDKPEKNRHSESCILGMNRALEYIKANLNKPLTLEEISRVALLSKFHFHRIFKMVTSESLAQFIQRLRIEKAANLINVDTAISLTDIAMNCGFSSSAYFSRIFKEHFGISASAFRQLSFQDKQHFIQSCTKGLIPLKKIFRCQEELTVCIETIPGINVAYIRKYYLDLQEEPAIIHRMFHYITAWGNKKGLMARDTRVMGIIHDNPYITPFSKYQYDACISVPQNVSGEGIVGVKSVQAGKYAVLKVRNANKEILESSIYTFVAFWLPKSGFRVADRQILEVYYGHQSLDEYTMDFCVPIITD